MCEHRFFLHHPYGFANVEKGMNLSGGKKMKGRIVMGQRRKTIKSENIEEKELKKSWKNCTAHSVRNAFLVGSSRLSVMSRSARRSGSM